MNVLVTGGTGVVGTAAVPALVRAGHHVRLLSRHAERDARAMPDGVEAFEADITSAEALFDAVRGCDCILHIAGIVEEAPPDITFERVNVEGTRFLIQAAAAQPERPFFICISSLGADRGKSDYHRSKSRAEDVVAAYTGPWVILRPAGVYGPGDETISTLLKMVRTLPAVPMVSMGDQPFQPLWYADFGEVIVQTVARPELAGRTLEIAGPEVTTTDQVIKRLSEITGRNVPTMSVPVWVTEVGIQAMEAFGAMGRKLLRNAGLESPLSSAKLDMLLEENVIPQNGHNALEDFDVVPTRLEDGLRMLADLLPEQLPGDGVGTVSQATYWAEIHGSQHNAKALLDLVCERIHTVMPIEFAAEPGAPRQARQTGETLTAELPARGNIQVRLEERTDTRATFVTLEGHPLAGVMQLHTEDTTKGVRFNIHIASQPANVIDWVAMRTIGGPMQRANWRAVVRRVIELSGGEAPTGVNHDEHAMSDQETHDMRAFAERVVQEQQKTKRMEQVSGGASVERG